MPSLKNQNPETPEKQKIKNKIKQKIITMRDQRPKTSMPSFHLRKLEKEEPVKSKVNMRKEIKIRGETNEIGNRKSKENINKTRSCFFEKSIKSVSL